MTDNYEITKAYHRGDEVTICGICLDLFYDGTQDYIMHKLLEKWFEKKPLVQDYKYWKKDNCPDHKAKDISKMILPFDVPYTERGYLVGGE